ncbi:MAG: hypothetical protein DCC52_09740 [Chloroflexi bacterium]|nr:MAG: hypothetical protein DCC52_09740 [Chloroflexota bacterium]
MAMSAHTWSWRARLRTRLDAIIERPRALWVALFVIFLLVYGASIFLIPKRYGRLIVGDGIYYYVYLRSAVLDGDLNFQNDYEIYQSFNTQDLRKKQEMLERKTPIGMPANLFSVGPAVLWAPLFLLTHFGAALWHQTGDGYALWEQAPLMLASIAYGFIGILLMYRVTAGMFSKFAALVSLLGIWLATNVVYYMGISPSASHVLSMFASALFVYLWWRGQKGWTKLGWLGWGLSAGLMALVRWQDLLIALLALLEWIAVTRAARQTTKNWLALAGTFVGRGHLVCRRDDAGVRAANVGVANFVRFASHRAAGRRIFSMAAPRNFECVVFDQARLVFVVADFISGGSRFRTALAQKSFVGRSRDFDFPRGIVHQQRRQ